MSETLSDVVPLVVEAAAALPGRMRARNPRVHCITNTVAQAFTANTLLAVGATPSVTTSPEEIAGFVAGADGLLVNLGTLDNERREAIGLALDAAAAKALPVVLDPVFVERSPARLAFARTLIARRPAVIRLNAAELTALAGEDASADCARRFAQASGCVVALTGEMDVVTDGARLVALRNGDELMSKVTAMGCAGSAFVAGALAVEPDAWLATASAMMLFGIAGEFAAEICNGPGSLGFAILDTLYAISPDMVFQHAWAEA
jgi:hydroxyethylthiazole kinase